MCVVCIWTCRFQTINFRPATVPYTLQWADLDWSPGAHQSNFITPFLSCKEREKIQLRLPSTKANIEWIVYDLWYVKHINTTVHLRHHRSLENRSLILKRVNVKSMLEFQEALRFQKYVITNILKLLSSNLSTSSSYSDADIDHPKIRNSKAYFQHSIL